METLIQIFVKATGWSIIHSLWQGAILYAALLLVFVIHPKLKPNTRHNFSLATLLMLFGWFMITFYQECTHPLPLQSIDAAGYEYINEANHAVNYASFELSASVWYKAEQGIPLMVCIYMSGLLLQSVWLLAGYYRVWQIKTKGLSDLPQQLNACFLELAAKAGIKRPVRFALSHKVFVPLAVGYFKPVVLLPLSALTGLQPGQLEAIVIHELWHIRRNDYLLNFIKVSIESILFFNPFVWLCSKIIETERENACDDQVVALTGTPLTYAQTLLQLAALPHKPVNFAVPLTGKKYHLLNRIKRITNMKARNFNLKLQLSGILLVVCTLCSLAWIPAKKSQAAAEPGALAKTLHSGKAIADTLKAKKRTKINKSKLQRTYSTTPAALKTSKKQRIDGQFDTIWYSQLVKGKSDILKDTSIFPMDSNSIQKHKALYINSQFEARKMPALKRQQLLALYIKSQSEAKKMEALKRQQLIALYIKSQSEAKKMEALSKPRLEKTKVFETSKNISSANTRLKTLQQTAKNGLLNKTSTFKKPMGFSTNSPGILKDSLAFSGKAFFATSPPAMRSLNFTSGKFTIARQDEETKKQLKELKKQVEELKQEVEKLRKQKPGNPKQQETIKDIMMNPKNKSRIDDILKKDIHAYRMSAEGRLQKDESMIYVFPEGMVQKADIKEYLDTKK